MPEPIKGNRRYMYGLDGLRALAVLAVIFYHLEVPGASGGLLGVTVFFVLSGYLITDLLLTEWDQTQRIDFKRFWVRRARRLLPAMLMMLVVVVAYVALFDQAFLVRLRGDVLAALLYVSNWWFVFQEVSYFDNFQPSLLTHFWSLAVEEQFYLIWPVVIFFGLRYIRKRRILLSLTMLGAILSALLMAFMYEPGTDPSRVYYGTDTRAFSLLIGAALAMVWPSRKLSHKVEGMPKNFLDVVGSLGLLLFFLMVCFSTQYDTFLYRGGMVLLSIATAVIVAVLAHPASRLRKVLSFKPLCWIGERSYGMYLWHFPVIVLTGAGVDTDLFKASLQLVLIFALSALSYQLMEQPIRKGGIDGWLRAWRSGEWGMKDVSTSRWLTFSSSLLVLIVSTFVIYMVPASGADSDKYVKTEKASIEAVQKPASKQNKDSSVQAVAQLEQDRELRKITAIGDSVMIAVNPLLKQQLPDFVMNAEVGRQMSEGIEMAQQMEQQGQLGDVVIIGLGSNGPLSKKQLIEMVESLDSEKEILLINTRVPRPWEREVNASLKEVARDFENVALVDWYEASTNHPHYFISDQVHLSKEGQEVYTSLILDAIARGEVAS
ncbi:acyltransferase family protein [Bacillus sp. FJAT-42315]|uniref:acyltransferase family protein n=1 Tax=Bacillus sp. FJAT-42315 TaxID=2014077 RepID=UPI000C246F55|nr:acyltransferase family protein [Bacillus sp. FJAT-42315]